MNAKSLTTAVLLSAAISATVFAGSADEALNRSMSQYRSADTRGQWNNPWTPQATGGMVAHGASADERLTRIVDAYTREALDRGGWENRFMTNSRYASGNALLNVRIGEGVTTASSERADEPKAKSAACAARPFGGRRCAIPRAMSLTVND